MKGLKYTPHRLYIDSLPAVVEAPSMQCPACQSYQSDEMQVEEVDRKIGVASRRTILWHKVFVESYESQETHTTVCYHEMRRRGLECCFWLIGQKQDFPAFMQSEHFHDRLDQSGDELNGRAA